ncbi:MAG: hypothetical protein ABIS69_08760 [Sediminibacterium sp.]
MKFFLFACFLQILLGSSCAERSRHQLPETGKTESKTQQGNKPKSSFPDTIQINYPAAVFYRPDALQLESLKAVTDSMVLESTMHQLFYQMRNARIVLKKYHPTIKIVEVVNARWLLFILKNGVKKYIDLDKNNDPEGLYIFNVKKEPLVVDMMNVETELGFYLAPVKP